MIDDNKDLVVMGNTMRYQVVIRTNNGARIAFPGLVETWDDIIDARRTFDLYVNECRHHRCKRVYLVEIDEDEEDRVIDRYLSLSEELDEIGKVLSDQ